MGKADRLSMRQFAELNGRNGAVNFANANMRGISRNMQAVAPVAAPGMAPR